MPKRKELTDEQLKSLREITKNIKRVFGNDEQKEISTKTGLPQSKISKILAPEDVHGQWSALPDLITIANAYDVPLPSLFERFDDIHYKRKTLRDAAQAILTLNALLGLTIQEDDHGRPVMTFQYSGMDDFLFMFDATRNTSKSIKQNVSRRILPKLLSAEMDIYKDCPEHITSVQAVRECREILPYYIKRFGAESMLHYRNAEITVRKEMQKSTLGSGSGAPQILVTVYDSERRNDTEIFQETFPELPPEESRNLLKESMLALLDDVPEKDREIDPELLLRLFSE